MFCLRLMAAHAALNLSFTTATKRHRRRSCSLSFPDIHLHLSTCLLSTASRTDSFTAWLTLHDRRSEMQAEVLGPLQTASCLLLWTLRLPSSNRSLWLPPQDCIQVFLGHLAGFSRPRKLGLELHPSGRESPLHSTRLLSRYTAKNCEG
jgi:hypothetical protein